MTTTQVLTFVGLVIALFGWPWGLSQIRSLAKGEKIKEKRIATAMETLALVYELSERFDRAGSRP
jgi:hypothetical protein